MTSDSAGLPRRILGRTGVPVSIIGLGGFHIGAVKDDNESIRIMHAAIDEGLTFFDNAWDYHEGRSEELMGRAIQMIGRRNRVFLMTKNCERDYEGSMKCLEDSLRRLRTDYIDLWQFHELGYDNDPEWIFERGGIGAALEARRQGKVRFLGFTGHKAPAIHLDMLSRGFEWDACQMPVNVMDAHYRSFTRHVIPVCQKQNVGVIGMKGLGGGYPEADLVTKAKIHPELAYRFCLSQPVATQVMGIRTMEQLKANVALARDFKPLSEGEQKGFIESVRDVAGDGRYESFKSTNVHDGPHHRKQHGFELAAAS